MNDDARTVAGVTSLKLQLSGDIDAPVVSGGFRKSGLDGAAILALLGMLDEQRCTTRSRKSAAKIWRSGRLIRWETSAPVAALAASRFWYDDPVATTQPILNELLAPLGDCLSPEVAQRIVRLRAPDSVQARVEELARKNTENLLSKQERDEYDALVSAGNFIAILQAKARRLLRDVSAS